MATSTERPSQQTRIIVVNGDANWQFRRLVRQHAADLYHQVPAVEFWETAGLEEFPAEHVAVWRDWPRLKHRSKATLAEDLMEEVQAAGSDTVILVFVFSSPEWFDAQPDLPLARAVLEALAQNLNRSRIRKSRVQRFAVFRCRPTENEDWLQDRVEPAFGLLTDHLVDHVWFLAAEADSAGEPADFAGLRVLIELFGDVGERKKLSPTGREGLSAVRWFKSFAKAPQSQVDGVRALLTRIIDDFERTAGIQAEQDLPPDAASQGIEGLSNQIDGMLNSMTVMLEEDGGADTFDVLSDFDTSRWLHATPWFYLEGIERDYQNRLDEVVNKLAGVLGKRIENLKSERQRSLKSFRDRERDIIASIEGLAATRLGLRGSAKRKLESLGDRVETARARAQEKLKGHRAHIIATALPIVVDGDSPGKIKTALRELKEFADLKSAMSAVIETVATLPQRRPFFLIILVWLAVILVPLMAFHLGNSLAATVAERVAALLPITWPGSHILYGGFLTVIGATIIARQVILKRRSLRKRVDDLLWQAKQLQGRANAALNSSLKYAQYDYALGWCTLLVERLEELRDSLDRAEEFTRAFEPLRLKGPVDEAVLNRFTQGLLPQLRESDREKWLPFLLDAWPDGQEVSIEVGGEGRFNLRSRFLPVGFAASEQELRIDVVPRPDVGASSVDRAMPAGERSKSG